MTQNQIAYQDLQETVRSHVANEALKGRELTETERANLARELETNRSNLANEAENNRSNLAREFETHRSNVAREVETNRANRAQEAIGWANAQVNARNQFETSRHNSNMEFITLEHYERQDTNQANANSNSLYLGLRGANTAQYNAETQRSKLITDVAVDLGQTGSRIVSQLTKIVRR